MKQVLFSESILYTDIEDKHIKKLFLSILKKEKQKNNCMLKSNRGGFQTGNILDQKLGIFLIKNAGDLIIEHYKFKNNIKLILSNFWINENNKHNYNRSHVHVGINSKTGLNINFSGIYYLEVPKNSGNLYFESNDIVRYSYENLNSNVIDNSDFRQETFFIPTKNKFIVFPAHLRHGVESNLSNKKRISVAFNFIIQNEI